VLLQASVTSLRAEWQAELAGLKSELDHKRRQAAAALKAKQEEEDLKVRRGGVQSTADATCIGRLGAGSAVLPTCNFAVPCLPRQEPGLERLLNTCCSAVAAALVAAHVACQALDFQAQQRLWALQQDELAAAGTSALQDAAAAQAAVLAAEQARKAAEWQAQDEARALQQQHEAARRARLVAAAEQEAARQAANGLLLAQELHTQEELLKVSWQCVMQ
jgi:hypothetical protein